MPKKTREEKILARLRRLEQSRQTPSEPAVAEVVKTSGYNLKEVSTTSKPTLPTPSIRNETIDYSYIRADLRKIIMLTVGALLVEIVLSLTASGWYAKLFPRLF